MDSERKTVLRRPTIDLIETQLISIDAFSRNSDLARSNYSAGSECFQKDNEHGDPDSGQ